MTDPIIIRSKRKTVELIIKPDGALVVRVPQRITRAQIDEILARKAGWIQEKQEIARSLPPPVIKKKYQAGETFLYLGTPYPLEIVDRAPGGIVLTDHFTLRKGDRKRAAELFTEWYRKSAKEYLSERAPELAKKNGYTYKDLRVTSARTRWGSCSSLGNLNFSWRLIMAPVDVIDYVILHELVHLEIKNHSRAFWARVEQLCPDYRQKRDWLKRHGAEVSL